MKLIHLFENYLSLDTIKEFNKQIRRHPLEDCFGKAGGATKTSIVNNIEYGHIANYMDQIFDTCQILNIDTLGYNIWQPTRYNYLNYSFKAFMVMSVYFYIIQKISKFQKRNQKNYVKSNVYMLTYALEKGLTMNYL